MEEAEKRVVEAIEEGRIVIVPEDYARREGLPILRRSPIVPYEEESRIVKAQKKRFGEEKRLGFDDFRKPMWWEKNEVVGELVENFYWKISKRRRERNLTRKQLAEEIGESENTIKMIENGVLPKDDFVLINKIQEALGLNLRRDKIDYSQSPREVLDTLTKQDVDESEEKEDTVLGDEIEILE